MEVSNGFKAVIKAYLDDRASNDELFAATYAKPNKSLDECCNYILQEVHKSGQNGFADEEIFGMAVHYYDEDDIKDVKPINARVVVNHHVDAPKPQPKQDKPQSKPQDKAKQDVAAKFKTQCANAKASKSAAPSTATTTQQDEQKRLAFMAEQRAKAIKEKQAKKGKDKPVQMSIW